MANAVPVGNLYKFVSHKRRVLSLYKRAQRHLESHCIRHGRATYCYERTLLRARFDKFKNEDDPVIATEILKMGEEEFWLNQHTMPVLFHNHPDGFAYAREETDRVDEKVMDKWSPKMKAHFPDYFQKREKWQELRKQTWEMEQDDLKKYDKQLIENGEGISEAMPASSQKDGYPPYWWRFVTRPVNIPKLMDFFPGNKDKW